MPAPQQLAPGVFYVPPPDEPVNVASSFLSGYLHTRTPYAQQVFETRLAAMDPAARAAALQPYTEAANAVVDGMRQYESDKQKYAVDMDQHAVDVYKAQMDYAKGVNVAGTEANARILAERIQQETKLSEMQNLTPKDRAPVEGLIATAQGKAKELADAKVALGQAMASGNPQAVLAAKAGVLSAAAGWSRASGEAIRVGQATLSGGQLASLDRELQAGRDAHLGAVSLGAENDAAIGTAVGDAWTRYKDDQRLMPTYVPPAPGPNAVAGMVAPPRAPALGGGAASIESGTGGTAPADPYMDAAKAQLAAIEKQRGEVSALFDNPYGGFNDPLPGTPVGVFGRRRQSQASDMARALADAQMGRESKGASTPAEEAPAAENGEETVIDGKRPPSKGKTASFVDEALNDADTDPYMTNRADRSPDPGQPDTDPYYTNRSDRERVPTR